MPLTQLVHIRETVPLPPPRAIRAEQPATADDLAFVLASRDSIERIISGTDSRFLVIVGPCSIHDDVGAVEYARRLRALSDKVRDRMLLVMRVYFEKPRTTVGWKGLINDPHLNNSFDILAGLKKARRILLDVTRLGVPAATEFLEPVTPLYISDLISLASIGARTTESPTHRQMASGLSMPVGQKNGTDGSLKVALDAMKSSMYPHSFLGINDEGVTSVIHTTGNRYVFPILRGGTTGPNFSSEQLRDAVAQLTKAELPPRLAVDCSHANSDKDFRKQARVWKEVLEQRLAGNMAIIGMMLESHLFAGKQNLCDDPSQLQYGVSITDGCIGWDETEELILDAFRALDRA